MDIFCEYLVERKSPEDRMKKAGLVLACILVCFIVVCAAFFVFNQLITYVPILVAAAIYGTVLGCRHFSIEYEYVFINGTLDIDIIRGRSKRKNLVSIPCRKIESMERLTKSYTSNKKVIDAIYDKSRSGKYVVTFSNDGVATDVYFQPPEKLLMNMKKYNPRNINL